jgi:hypothetical protein
MNDQMNREELFNCVYVKKWKLDYFHITHKPGIHKVVITNPENKKISNVTF